VATSTLKGSAVTRTALSLTFSGLATLLGAAFIGVAAVLGVVVVVAISRSLIVVIVSHVQFPFTQGLVHPMLNK
jgi:hypothetical protein